MPLFPFGTYPDLTGVLETHKTYFLEENFMF